jgi:DNA end-binding protein Ku
MRDVPILAIYQRSRGDAMRSLWKGVINFGMVTIPCKLYTATVEKDVRFRLVHKKDGAPIVEKRFCSAEDKEVPWADIGRGYEVKKGEFVVLDAEEIEEAAPESTHTIDIGDFVELEEIDPIYFEKSYFLEPADVGAKPFNLLRRALAETGRVAVARVVIRTRERLATLRVYEQTLVLETMYWPDEIRSIRELDLPSGKAAAPAPREVEMARSLIENLASHFDPDAYKDEFRSTLHELIERKMRGERRQIKRRQPEAKVIDLMEALQKSLSESKSSSGRRSRTAGTRRRVTATSARSTKSAPTARRTRKTAAA